MPGKPFPSPPSAKPPFPGGAVVQAAPLKPMASPMDKVIEAMCTVYVGKIAPGIEDEFIRKLLEVLLAKLLLSLTISFSFAVKLRIGNVFLILSLEN